VGRRLIVGGVGMEGSVLFLGKQARYPLYPDRKIRMPATTGFILQRGEAFG